MIWNTEVINIEGDEKQVNKIMLKNNKTNEELDLNVKGLFVAIGHTPNSQFVSDLIECDNEGYIITNRKCETNVKGIYACGDVMDPHYRQAITASGSGCIAALECERSLHE
jgi:thioredoxin reductase (NADPH)